MSAKPEAANDSIAALEHKVETMRHELNIARARAEAYLKLLTGIHALLYPPSIKMADGSVMLFRPQNLDPHAVLQELSDRIRALSDELADPGDERERREADETDAARYRWLREWRARWEIRYWNGIYWNQLITDELGAAIDAAIAAERGGK